MSNQLLTIVQITREALRILHNNVAFTRGVNRQYASEFARTGAKIGSTVNVRKPNRYYLRKGQTIQVQGTNEQYVPLTLTTQYGIDTSFSSQDLTLSLDDFGKRVLSPKMARISSGIDQDGLAQVGNVYNNVGTPGTTPGSNAGSGLLVTNAPQIFLNAGMMLDNFAAPRDDNRHIILNPAAQAGSISGLSGLFNDQGTLGAQYKNGVMGRALGFMFAMDQNVNIQQTGSRANGTANGANQTGSNFSITGAGNAATIYPYECFTVANEYSVNPENLQSTAQLQQFTVMPNPSNANGIYTCDANGNATLVVSPSIVGPSTPTNPLQNVNALNANGANLTWAGAANGTAYFNNVAYHQDAFTFATADLIMPGGVDFAAREVYDGISMRIIRAYDITNDQLPDRIDVLGGWATLRPELACRIWG